MVCTKSGKINIDHNEWIAFCESKGKNRGSKKAREAIETIEKAEKVGFGFNIETSLEKDPRKN